MSYICALYDASEAMSAVPLGDTHRIYSHNCSPVGKKGGLSNPAVGSAD